MCHSRPPKKLRNSSRRRTEDGEAAGTSLVQRIRRDSRRRELRTGGLSSAQSWFGWRAHIALEDPVGTVGDQVLTPAIAAASRHIADEAEAPTLAAELRARIDAAKVALQGGGRELMAQGSAAASALRFGVAGESAEALVGEAWVRCKVIGDGEGADEVTR